MKLYRYRFYTLRFGPPQYICDATTLTEALEKIHITHFKMLYEFPYFAVILDVDPNLSYGVSWEEIK
jgi:hypothetical protein